MQPESSSNISIPTFEDTSPAFKIQQNATSIHILVRGNSTGDPVLCGISDRRAEAMQLYNTASSHHLRDFRRTQCIASTCTDTPLQKHQQLQAQGCKVQQKTFGTRTMHAHSVRMVTLVALQSRRHRVRADGANTYGMGSLETQQSLRDDDSLRQSVPSISQTLHHLNSHTIRKCEKTQAELYHNMKNQQLHSNT